MVKKIAFLLLLLFIAINIEIANAIEISAEPSFEEIFQGDLLRVDILAKGASNFSALQLDLNYDPNILHYQDTLEGTFFSINGKQTILLNTIKQGTGVVRDISIVSIGEGVNGDGLVFSIYFRAIGTGSSNLDPTNVQVADNKGLRVTNVSIKSSSVNTHPAQSSGNQGSTSTSSSGGSSSSGGNSHRSSTNNVALSPITGMANLETNTNANTNICLFDWECKDWGECKDGLRKRECQLAEVTDYVTKEGCPTPSNPPIMEVECGDRNFIDIPFTNISKFSEYPKVAFSVFNKGVFMFLLGALIFVFVMMKLPKSIPYKIEKTDTDQAREYIKTMRDKGIIDSQIYYKFLKAKWRSDTVIRLLDEKDKPSKKKKAY